MPLNDLFADDRRDLERIISQQQRVIERLRGKRNKFSRALKRSGKGSFVRVIFGDVHGMYHDPAAVAAFLDDVRFLKPHEIVCVGDLISCDGFLAEHHVIGVIPQLDYSYEADVCWANDFLDQLAKLRCHLTYICGNHEGRVERQIAKMVLGRAKDARFLEKLYGPASVLGLEKRGVRYIRRDQYYDGLSVSGTIKLEPFAVAQHGEAFSNTTKLLSVMGCNVFHGHTHRLQIVYSENISSSIVGVNTGCLCQKRPLYGLTKVTGWSHGYAVQFVCSTGFLALPVPIIDGVSYLSPMLRCMTK